MLHVACGNRREAVCPACSAVYKRDARQLVRAGLAGGKGIPETITAHPCVFATLTAPSFGPVHSRRMRGKTVLPCRPRRDANARRCPHGRDISCPTRHVEDDPRLGQPMCGDCYDYTAAVLFNAWAGTLWRRFTTYLPRHLARRLGITQKRLRALVRVRYVKVAEYQARGVVHFHAVIRLDAPGDDYRPPPPGIDAAMLCDAVRAAAAAVRIAQPDGTGTAITLSFGAPQGTDVRPIRRDDLAGTGQPLNHQAVANYIAKYATKTLTVPGLPAQRLRHLVEIEHLRCPAHYKRMITTAWQLGGKRQTGDPRFRQWAHMLGYGGHFLTKSRRYSVTFGQLRKARTDHRRAERHPGGERDPWGRPLDETVVLVIKHLDLRRNRLHRRPRRPARARLRSPRTRALTTMPHDTASRPKESDEHVSPSEANRKQLYRVADAMVVLSMSRSVIYEQIRSGRLRSVTQGRSAADPCLGHRGIHRTS